VILLKILVSSVYSKRPIRPVWPVHVHTLAGVAGAWFIRTGLHCLTPQHLALRLNFTKMSEWRHHVIKLKELNFNQTNWKTLH